MALPEMVSLEGIQGLVDQLQLKILGSLGSKNASTQADLQRDWRKIKIAIGNYTVLSKAEDRKRLGHLIHAQLDGLGLEGSVPGPISVKEEEEKIRKDPEAGKTQKKPPPNWIPY